MYNAPHLSSVSQAREELDRLHAIELNLCNQISALMDDTSYISSAWRSIYYDRLRDNVRPSILECVKYIRKHG